MTESIPGEYSHSGKLGAGIFVVPIGGLVASVVLSIIYAYVDLYSPVAGYISILFVAGLGLGLGWTISKLGYLSRCRNSAFLYSVGLACGLLALYTSWAVFEYALMSRYDEDFTASLLEVFLSPTAVWEVAQWINSEGWYTVFSSTPSGTVLWIFWGIEAIIIVGGSALLSTVEIAEQVFCEGCDQWCSRTSDAIRFGIPEDRAELQELRPDNLNPIAALCPADSSAANYLRLETWNCNTCNETAALQVKICATVPDEDGNPKEDTEDLTQIWSVPSDTLGRIMNLAIQSPEQTPESYQQG